MEYHDDSYSLEDQDDDLEIILTDDSSMCSNSMFSAKSSNSNSSSCSCSNSTTHETIEHHNANDEDQMNSLQKQLEYYFSRNNLANDIYLVSQMDIDLYVPIVLIANFHRVKQYTTDLNEIIQVLKRSSYVIVDETETKVKPNISPSVERTTVILRELPQETTEKEITEFLRELNSSPVKSIKYDFGNIWYITFKSEKDALKFFHDIRGCLFKEKPVAARMKSVPGIHNLFESLTRLRNQQQQECSVSKNNHKIEDKNDVNNSERKYDNVNDNNTQSPAKKRRRRRGSRKSKRCREQRQEQQQEHETTSEKPANDKNSIRSITTMDNKNVNNDITSTYKQQSNVVTYATIVKRRTIQQQ
ncbi:hypothetical protein INT45_010335 [Circinella minor]|uniref:HTH La-type RNA-binding domain-containing protein n=1 Tax=Circinella minor TaxID=1195481 RepID=A0A8H7SCH2_9FUNG|nr:hypothetical protein INT45_010335 [Circinella minor]